jgi:hypothetical protein
MVLSSAFLGTTVLMTEMRFGYKKLFILVNEIGQINFSGEKIPTLELKGRYDTIFPYETSTKPMVDLLRNP